MRNLKSKHVLAMILVVIMSVGASSTAFARGFGGGRMMQGQQAEALLVYNEQGFAVNSRGGLWQDADGNAMFGYGCWFYDADGNVVSAWGQQVFDADGNAIPWEDRGFGRGQGRGQGSGCCAWLQ